MSMPNPLNAPYGAFALSPFKEKLRRAAMNLPTDGLRRGAESVVRRMLMSDGREIADIEVFAGQFARLHLTDNRCEKRAFVGSKTWDSVERAAIRDLIGHTPANHEFVFVDAGANAGLYSLSALADAATQNRSIRIIAIEPDIENRRRLEFNIFASNASNVTILPYALGAREGEAVLLQSDVNRGEVRVSEVDEGEMVRLRPLASALQDGDVDYVDMMKMDIEGFEEPVLQSFFEQNPRQIWPRVILLETRHEAAITEGAAGLCLRNGYELTQQTRQNAVLSLPNGKA
jgi:FkbM family methyltransferase